MGNQARNEAAVELAQRNAVGRWLHENDPAKASASIRLLWILSGIVLASISGYFAALVHVNTITGAKQKWRERRFKKDMQGIEKENQVQSDLSKSALSKEEMVIRLGTIDQYIRVLESEADPSKRTVALQAAHSEMITLAAKLASGEVPRAVLKESSIREQAMETSKDLVRLGLAGDRLNRDLIRIFQLREN